MRFPKQPLWKQNIWQSTWAWATAEHAHKHFVPFTYCNSEFSAAQSLFFCFYENRLIKNGGLVHRREHLHCVNDRTTRCSWTKSGHSYQPLTLELCMEHWAVFHTFAPLSFSPQCPASSYHTVPWLSSLHIYISHIYNWFHRSQNIIVTERLFHKCTLLHSTFLGSVSHKRSNEGSQSLLLVRLYFIGC